MNYFYENKTDILRDQMFLGNKYIFGAIIKFKARKISFFSFIHDHLALYKCESTFPDFGYG